LKRFINSILSILLLFLLLSCSTGEQKKEKNDVTLIVPGESAEGFIINTAASTDDAAEIIQSSVLPDFFSPLFTQRQNTLIKFNSVIYLRNRYAVFVNDGTVSAIAGLSPSNRVTDDAFRLTEGADSFIMNYGNSGLKIIKDGRHRIYLYNKLGIAVFDDNGDDSIEMYIVFPPDK